jgi:putative hydrolase of HD superfamily
MTTLLNNRLVKQLEFLHEIDKLKTIFRRTNLISEPERLENSAEHSWHLAFYVLILAEHTNTDINLLRVLKMVLLHDVVEIDAGDTFCYDDKANESKSERELKAAERLFGLLPADQRDELMQLWQEFEAGVTPDAKFAVTVDRLQPLLHNYVTGGGSWKRHNIKRSQVEDRMKPIQEGSRLLAEMMKGLLDEAVDKKILAI